MISIDEMREMLGELLDELPEAFFEELNGGVCLLEEAKRDPAAREDDLYILGEYCEGPLGRSIVLYYGSFARLFGRLGPLQLRRELRKTVRHEFRHHIEALAGEDALDREDEAQFGDYLRRHAARGGPGAGPARRAGSGPPGGRLFRRRRANDPGHLKGERARRSPLPYPVSKPRLL